MPPDLAAGSKLVALLRVLGKPMELLFTDSHWLGRRLPQAEVAYVRHARIGLLVPITLTPGRTEALLVLGMKRSEEPYTHADQELLETIASSLAMLFEQSRSSSTPDEGRSVFKECRHCGTCYGTDSEHCATDGSDLTTIPFSRILAHRYRLDRRLGRGGMGTVYEAKDDALDRRVAVKLIRDDLVNHEAAAKRFRREARAAAGFTHPNVVTVHDYGVESGARAFLVMELLEGGTLRDELCRRLRLDPARIVDVMRAVSSAVNAAHGRNLIHRDLKPENVFVARRERDRGEVVKVLDFGIATFAPISDNNATGVTSETETGVLLGTIAYMAPEQLLGQAADVRWDVWSLGVMLYECLTGALPFPMATLDDWRRTLLSGNFVPLENHIDAPRKEWRELFSSCFAVDRTRRPQSAAELFGRVEAVFTEGFQS
jgi:serine/threonine-protein kinase